MGWCTSHVTVTDVLSTRTVHVLPVRMETAGVPGRVHVSADTHALVRHLGGEFGWECRGEVDVKGVGPMTTYLLRQDGQDDACPSLDPPEVPSDGASQWRDLE